MTTIYDWPEDLAPTEMSIDLMTPAAIYTDPRSGTRLRQRRSNDIWVASMSFRDICRDKWKKLAGFLAKIEGPIGRIRLYDFSDPVPDGEAGAGYFGDGTGYGDGGSFEEADIEIGEDAAIGETTITLRILTALTGPALLAGDCFSLPNDRRYIVTADMETQIGGAGALVTVDIMPPLVEAVVDGDAVNVYWPTEIFNLVSKPVMPRSIERFVSVDLQFVQDVRA